MQWLIILAILTTGLSGIGAQVLLLRELLVSFFGNELIFGVVLGNWLVAEALGAWWGGRRERGLRTFLLLQVLFSIALLGSLTVARVFKALAGEEAVAWGLIQALCQSAWVLLPTAFLHGALFPVGCSLLGESKGATGAITAAYVWETLGTILGGLTVAFFLLPLFKPFELALALAVLHLLLCGLLCLCLHRRIALILLLTIGLLLPLLPAGADRLEEASLRRRWSGYEILHHQNSLYGNLVALRRAGEQTFFLNGSPIITVPNPNPALEVFVHVPMLHHRAPRRVLVISGGTGGILQEVLKHPVEEVDYAELDPLLIELVRKYPTSLTARELGDRRVKLWTVDGRKLLQVSEKTYDVILMGLGLPSDLQVNRLFTLEAFRLMAARLRPGGIIAFELPGSSVYMGPELRGLMGLLLGTLKEVFPEVKVALGEGTLVMASKESGTLKVSEEVLTRRMRERGLRLRLLTPSLISYLFQRRRLQWFWENLELPRALNEDLHPLGVFHALAYHNALFDPKLVPLFDRLRGLPARWGIPIPLVLFLVLFLGRGRVGVPTVLATTGFAGMAFDLLLLYAFQTFHGYVYQWIGLLITAFMVGVALGAWCTGRFLTKGLPPQWPFLTAEAGVGLYALLLPVALGPLRAAGGWAFLPLCLLGGAVVGGQFPAGAALYLRHSEGAGRTGGLLYAADLMGGWVGGILAGVVLLPLRGFQETCLFLAALKGAGLLGIVGGGIWRRY